MYELRPTRTSSRAKLLAAALLLLAVASFAASSLVPQYPALLQCLGLVLLIPLIQITARYLVLQYLYRVRPRDDGGVDLEVFTYRGGARMQLVCRVGLKEIVAVSLLDGENAKPPHGTRRYNYHPDMAPRKGLLLFVENGDGKCEILLAYDQALQQMLTGGKH
ncbi:MAG: hypothetical protein E7650_02130 [Ruminococcaceae bacterium]|nr:hypothetical protein [Oscillospiraceae bacterium]